MSELIDELLADARDRMAKSVEATQGEFNSVRTGRASPSLLDRIQVDYYGSPTPLKQLASNSGYHFQLLSAVIEGPVTPYPTVQMPLMSLYALLEYPSNCSMSLIHCVDGFSMR